MKIHFSYSHTTHDGNWGFGDFVLTGDDVFPPNHEDDITALKKRIADLEKVDSVVIIAWNIME